MPNCEIARCTVTIEATLPIRQYGWIARGVTTHYSLPFRSHSERAHVLRLLAAYVGPAVTAGAVENLAALLCLYHGGDEAAAHYLDQGYGVLLAMTPLEEVDEVVGLLLAEAAATAGTR